MLKRSMVALLVIALLISFSAVVMAEDLDEGVAPKNNAGVRILVDDDGDGVNEIHFLDAVPDHAEDNPSGTHPTNPIRVAGN